LTIEQFENLDIWQFENAVFKYQQANLSTNQRFN